MAAVGGGGGGDERLALVEQALLTLYHDPDPNRKQEAERWLEDVKSEHTPDSWTLALELIQPGHPPEAQFFGANFLHEMVMTDFGALPQELATGLRDSLFAAALAAVKGSTRAALRQLCQLVGAYVLQAVPELWSSVVADICAYCSQAAAVVGVRGAQILLLELLGAIPQHIHSAGAEFGPRLPSLRHELELGRPIAMSFLLEALEDVRPRNTQVVETALRCLVSWLEFGLVDLADTTVHLQAVIGTLRNPDVYEHTIDCLITLFSHTDPERTGIGTLANMIEQVIALQPMYEQAAIDGNQEVASGICRLMTVLAECNTKALIGMAARPEQLELTRRLLGFILNCTGHPAQFPTEEQISEHTLRFWGGFVEILIHGSREDRAQSRAIFAGCLLTLLEIFRRKVQLPLDAALDTEEADLMDNYRTLAGEAITYISCLLKDQAIGLLLDMLGRDLETGAPWQQVEATLFCISKAGTFIPHKDVTYAPQLIVTLAKLPEVPEVQMAALLVVGSLASWLTHHQEMLSPLLGVLLNSLLKPDLAQAASQSLVDLAEETGPALAPYIDSILETSTQARLSGVPLEARQNHVRALCFTVKHIDPTQYMPAMAKIIGPEVEWLQLSLQDQEDARQSRTAVLMELRLLACACLACEGAKCPPEMQHPVAYIVEAAWPAMAAIYQHCHQDEELMAANAEVLRAVIRVSADTLLPSLPAVAESLTAAFGGYPSATLLTLATELVNTFAKMDDASAACVELYSRLCFTMLEVFQTSNAQDTPELVQAFYQFLAETLGRTPTAWVIDGLGSALFQWCTAGLGLSNPSCIRAAAQALVVFIKQSGSRGEAAAVVAEHGQMLLDTCLQSLASVERTTLEDFGAIMFALCRKGDFLQCMEQMLLQPGYPNELATEAAKHQLCQAIAASRGVKKTAIKAVLDFSRVVRKR